MEDFAAMHATKSDRLSPDLRFDPAQTMSEDDKSILEKGHQNHTLVTQFRGSDEENQADESHAVLKTDAGHAVPYKWDTLLDPFVSGAKRFPDNEIVLSEQVENFYKGGLSPLQEKRTTPAHYTPSPARSGKPVPRSKKDQRQSQSSTRSILSKATRDLIFNDSTDSSDIDCDGPLQTVDSIEEVVPSNVGALQMSRDSFDDHEKRQPVKSFKIKKTTKRKQLTQQAAAAPSSGKDQVVPISSSDSRIKLPKENAQTKPSQVFSEEKNALVQQHPFTIANLFANSCSPSHTTKDEKDEKNDILMAKPASNLAFLADVFQCGNQHDDDVISPRNTQFVLDTFDRTLCGIPAKMANISLDDLLDDEFEDDLDMRTKSRRTRSRSKKESTTPTSISKLDTSSLLYGVLKEHMGDIGVKHGGSNSHTARNSIDNDPQVQRELQRLCKLLEAKLDGHGLEEPAYESDFDDYYDDESESDYDDEEEKLFESWMRSGPIMDLFGIGCNEKNSARREITYNDRIAAGHSYHRNERFYPEEEDEYSDGFDEDYYSDAESTETIVAANDYK